MLLELILYNDFYKQEMLVETCRIIDELESKKDICKLEIKERISKILQEIIKLPLNKGFEGNLWHMYIADLLSNSENTGTLLAEKTGILEGTVRELMLHDCHILRKLFNVDFKKLADILDMPVINLILDYKGNDKRSHEYSAGVVKAITGLANDLYSVKDDEGFMDRLLMFYRDYGTGQIGLHRAFRVVNGEIKNVNSLSGILEPIHNIQITALEDLIGLEDAKRRLTHNTEAFLEDKNADNCLLFGDAGTGKSTSIKALANMYYKRGLRIIEVYKHQLGCLPPLIARLKNRNYKFIIFMDDLSFEESEIEYKYLKAIIEGGLEKKPSNVLIYATSNRRHLVNEKFSDREDSIHAGDTVQEKLSLSARFGCTIYFGAPDKKEYLNIVLSLAKKEGLEIPEEELTQGAMAWELSNGGRTGRCAKQYIDYLTCKYK